jgi:hypothetical protein
MANGRERSAAEEDVTGRRDRCLDRSNWLGIGLQLVGGVDVRVRITMDGRAELKRQRLSWHSHLPPSRDGCAAVVLVCLLLALASCCSLLLGDPVTNTCSCTLSNPHNSSISSCRCFPPEPPSAVVHVGPGAAKPNHTHQAAQQEGPAGGPAGAAARGARAAAATVGSNSCRNASARCSCALQCCWQPACWWHPRPPGTARRGPQPRHRTQHDEQRTNIATTSSRRVRGVLPCCRAAVPLLRAVCCQCCVCAVLPLRCAVPCCVLCAVLTAACGSRAPRGVLHTHTRS